MQTQIAYFHIKKGTAKCRPFIDYLQKANHCLFHSRARLLIVLSKNVLLRNVCEQETQYYIYAGFILKYQCLEEQCTGTDLLPFISRHGFKLVIRH